MKFSVITLFWLVLVGSALSFLIKGKSPQVDPRIINGEEAVPHSLPWQVYLDLFNDRGVLFSTCGAALISPYYVLTAAHCLHDVESVSVLLGAHNLTNSSESTRQNFTSSELKQHEGYDFMSGSVDNDIALIKLPQAAIFTDAVKPAALSTLSSEQLVGKYANLSGWGVVNPYAVDGPDTLRVTKIEISPNSVCDVWRPYYNSSMEICSNGPNNHGPCYGDSGGPLTLDGQLVGLVSYGSTTCNDTTSKPAGFSRISYYIDWIKENTK